MRLYGKVLSYALFQQVGGFSLEKSLNLARLREGFIEFGSNKDLKSFVLLCDSEDAHVKVIKIEESNSGEWRVSIFWHEDPRRYDTLLKRFRAAVKLLFRGY